MKAIVLAAGHGTRLRPFTCATPKPLMPVWGVTMLDRMVDLLRGWGVDDFAFNSHHLHEQIRSWSDKLRKRFQERGEKVRVKVSYEPEILGNGGALNPLREWIGNEPFLLVNGDIVVDGIDGFQFRFDDFAERKDVIAEAIVTEQGPRTIEVEPESGFVTNWKSDDRGYPGTFTYAGISLLKPEILDYVEPEGFSSIITAYERAMADGKFVRALAPSSMNWADAGTIMSYIDLNRDGADNAFDAIPQVREVLVSLSGGQGAVSAQDSAAAIEFLGARGSERVFFREGGKIIVMYDDGNRDENGKYAGHSRWLKAHGIPVPEILFDRPEIKTLAMEFAGVEKKMSLVDYAKVVETLVKFNSLGSEKCLPDLLPPFDDETWEWERMLFEKYCLKAYFGMEMPDAVRKELEGVAEMLEAEPKALVHRDFQSTNVLWKNGELCFIDFQGMRLGPAAYDLASLVYDPYVDFSEKDRAALIALYAKTAKREEFVKVVPFAAVQRLCQCLGAYGRLASVGQPQFKRHVVPALRNLLVAADEAGLDAVGALAEDLLGREMKNSR